MKKAKIMLSAIAVIAVLSGTLAFKAHYKGTPHTYYFCKTTAAATTGTCTTAIETAVALSTAAAQGFSQFTTYATLSTTITSCTLNTSSQPGGCNLPLFENKSGI